LYKSGLVKSRSRVMRTNSGRLSQMKMRKISNAKVEIAKNEEHRGKCMLDEMKEELVTKYMQGSLDLQLRNLMEKAPLKEVQCDLLIPLTFHMFYCGYR